MRFSILLLTVVILTSCTERQTPIKDGDFLFLSPEASDLSQAIDAVTADSSGHHYTHMGLARVGESGKVEVWHAAPDKGVTLEPLEDFRLGNDGQAREMHVYRMPDSMAQYQHVIWKRAGILKGQPYNRTYVMEDTGYYCSEFIYALYSNFRVFELSPMTFRDPGTGDISETWKQYYAGLGIQVPEGKPGCNPNRMSKNPYLRQVAVFTAGEGYKIPD